MANNENLLTPEERNLTSEEASKMGTLGGIASGVAKRKAKSLREIANAVLEMKATKKDVAKIRETFPEASEDMTNADIIVLVQLSKARKGDTKSFELVRGTSGQDPAKQLDIGGSLVVGEVKVTKEDLDEALEKAKDLL